MCDINGIYIGELNLSNDLKILNNGWKVYIYCENRKIIIYISREIINPPFNETIMSNSNIILGYLEANLDNFNDFSIRMLRANIKRQGIGSYLFYILAYISDTLGIENINLENMSGINNYYDALGCEYDEEGLPEMTCVVKNIKKTLKLFMTKYLYNNKSIYFTPVLKQNFKKDKKSTRSIISKKK